MAKKQFKAESKKLLDMMINSIYTHKEIFLREIISNASDAIDKLCYQSLTDENVGMARSDFKIRVTPDKDARTITVSDNGIGMTKEELDSNLGVIARSGSLKFKDGLGENAQEDAAIDIIGQFGVGFYSAFMVADKVTVITRAYGSDTAYQWVSTGADGYTITEAEKDTVGTDVIMHIKEDETGEKYSTYLENWKLMMLIRKYSDYVRWPIVMDVEQSDWVDTGEKDEKGEPKMEMVTKTEEQTINSMIPIWQRSRKEATDEECIAFYKDKFHDKDDPLAVIRVNAEEEFLGKLKGVTDPERKRKIIGEEFIRVFERVGKQIGRVDYLVQGTIYPDVIESGLGNAAVIKSHHNVGGLPDYVDFREIIEPLRILFKDEVRQLGRELGLPEYLVNRQPFPGPGLAIRIIGEVTKEKADLLREADAIYREEIDKAGLNRSIAQYFAVLTNLRSVGVMGDGRTYDYAVALRAVDTSDFMTADWSRIPYDVLDRISSRIVNEVKGVNRVLFDVTSKPPATIEWE